MSYKEIHSFNTLYTRYYKKAFLFTKSFVHDESVAEDIVSDALIKLWESLKEKEKGTDYTDALLLTILKNKSLDHLKHEAIKAEAIHSMSSLNQRELEIRISTLQACDPEEIFSEEVKKIITDTLATLPEQTRHIFIMSRFQNKSNKEIAEQLNIAETTVKTQVQRAYRMLRERLVPIFLLVEYLQQGF